MIDHYNAFISYRHAEKDIKIAKEIQSDLEHFHVPGKIRKSSGMKSIDRIFLDKDELGTASDLSSEIAHALENADYLIVICSTATKESRWVPREIEYFLRNHTRKQITTVLVDGEPEDVIPDILKYEDRTYLNEAGQAYTVRVPLEPLSCDYRLPHKRAKKEELPRLASALLSCSYDELMNRRRQYKIRRHTAIFLSVMAVMLGFGCYLFYSRRAIRKNYDTALRNQSKYLANESLSANENEQRILAIQLALAALPQDEEDTRPVTPQAIRALVDSTMAYAPLVSGNVAAVWNYDMPNSISDFKTDSTGRTLAALDVSGNVIVWNTGDHKVLYQSTGARDPSDELFFLTDTTLLVSGGRELRAVSLADGSILWKYTCEEGILLKDPIERWGDDAVLLRGKSKNVYKISQKDGKLLETYSLEQYEGAPGIVHISPDGKKIAYTLEGDTADLSSVCVLNTADRSVLKADIQAKHLRHMIWADDKHIIAEFSSDNDFGSMSMMGVSFLETDHKQVFCLDPTTMKELWKKEFEYNDVMIQSDFFLLPKTESVAFYCGNHAVMYRVSDGEEIASFMVNTPVVTASDIDGDGWPLFVGYNGSLIMPRSADSVKIQPCMITEIKQASVGNGVFARKNNTSQIIHYQSSVHDEEWKEITKDNELEYFYEDALLDDGILSVLTTEKAEDHPKVARDLKGEFQLLTIIDPMTGALRFQIPLTDEDGKNYDNIQFRMLGTYGDYFYMGGRETPDSDYDLFKIHMNTGEITKEKLFHANDPVDRCLVKQGGKLIYVDNDDEHFARVNIMDLDTGKTETAQISDEAKFVSLAREPVYIPERNCVYIPTLQTDWIVFPEEKRSVGVILSEDWDGSKLVAYDRKNDRFAISDGSSIRYVNMDGSSEESIRCVEAAPLGMSYYTPKEGTPLLLVAFDNGFLSRYDAGTGDFVGKTELSCYTTMTGRAEFDLNASDRTLYIQIQGVTDVFDTETWTEETCITNSFGHHLLTDRFYTYSSQSNKYSIGYFPHYSKDDLVRKAKDILQGAEMSEEVKSQYGIGEDTP